MIGSIAARSRAAGRDGAAKGIGSREQGVHLAERKLGQGTLLRAQRALKEHGDLQKGLAVGGASPLPLLRGHLLAQDRHVEVDGQDLERRVTNDEVLR